jgi:hypothetical protein
MTNLSWQRPNHKPSQSHGFCSAAGHSFQKNAFPPSPCSSSLWHSRVKRSNSASVVPVELGEDGFDLGGGWPVRAVFGIERLAGDDVESVPIPGRLRFFGPVAVIGIRLGTGAAYHARRRASAPFRRYPLGLFGGACRSLVAPVAKRQRDLRLASGNAHHLIRDGENSRIIIGWRFALRGRLVGDEQQAMAGETDMRLSYDAWREAFCVAVSDASP